MALAVPDLLLEGIRLFNQGRYFEAHEIWEDLWRDSTGERRVYHQGLVQVAVGLHHLSRDNFRGGWRVLERGLRNLTESSWRPTTIDNYCLNNDIQKAIDTRRVPVIRIRTTEGPVGTESGEAV